MKQRLFFDGGCKPNPGKLEFAVVVEGTEQRFHERHGTGTSNEAEWLALLMAADIAKQLGFRNVEFVGDSQLIINQASGVWKAKGKWEPYLRVLKESMLSFDEVSFRQVPRDKNPAGHHIEDMN